MKGLGTRAGGGGVEETFLWVARVALVFFLVVVLVKTVRLLRRRRLRKAAFTVAGLFLVVRIVFLGIAK
ncbi:MAG: hypothetical protein R3F23_06680 [Verrucomicrobiia bacterium]